MHLIISCASWSVSANQCKRPYITMYHLPPGHCCQKHRDTANLHQVIPLLFHSCSLSLAVSMSPASLNTSQTPFSPFLQDCFTACRWQAVCSSCPAPWLPGTAFLEYLAQARLIQATVVWHTPVKREAEHRLKGLNCRSLLLRQTYMKDKKNPLAKAT